VPLARVQEIYKGSISITHLANGKDPGRQPSVSFDGWSGKVHNEA
jgi:hypothetical protein